jgi:PAS domain S-box-containing protein
MKKNGDLSSIKLNDIRRVFDETAIIAVTNQKGVITYVNQKFCDISKYTCDELVGNTHRIVNSGFHPKEFFREMWETILSGITWQGEIKNKAKDGAFFWVASTIVPLPVRGRKSFQFIAVQNEITERKTIEEAIEKAKSQFRTITDAVPVLISYVDKNGFYRFNNRNYEFWFGHSREEISGKHMKDVIGKAAWEKVRPRIERTLAGEETHYEDLLPYKDAGPKWVRVTYTPHRDQNGEIQGLVVLVNDISEQKRTVEDLKKREEQFRLLFENSRDALLVIDDEGCFLDLNETAAELIGYSREKLLKMNIMEIPTPETENLAQRYKNYLITGKETGEIDFFRPDGSLRTVEYTTSRFAEGRHLSILRDITERKIAEKNLAESEERYRLLFEQNPLPTWIMDMYDLCILDINEAAIEQYGYTRDEFLQMKVTDLYSSDFNADYIQKIAVIEKEINQHKSVPLIHAKKNGETFYAEVYYHRFNYKNRPARLCVARDVTERYRYTAELERSKKEILSILSSITDSFVSIDLNWCYTFVNPAAEKSLGKSAHELLGKSVWKVFPDAINSDMYTEFHRAVKTGKSSAFETFFNSRKKWLEVRVYPSEYGLTVYWRDITDLKKAAEQIREKSELLEQSYDAIFTWEIEGGITYWNQNAERLYGYTKNEAIGKLPSDLLKTVYPFTRSEFIEKLKKDGIWEGELIHTTKNGEEVIVESRHHTIKQEYEDLIVLESCHDITERKQYEAEMMRAAQLSLVGELAAGLAHEIKNPLSGIKGVIDIMLQRRAPEDKERGVLEDVRYEIERIDETVRALLNHARPKPLQIKMASLTQTVRRAVQFTHHKLSGKHTQNGKIAFKIDLPDDPMIIPHDSARIEDAVLNLILNAEDAIGKKEKGQISIRLYLEDSKTDGEAVIEVTDNGCGISKDSLKHIFTPFYTTHEHGTGLGLSAVRRIVRAHGGNCEVHSEDGYGSTFIIRLPAEGQFKKISGYN